MAVDAAAVFVAVVDFLYGNNLVKNIKWKIVSREIQCIAAREVIFQ
jgi:hypothetical protein